MATLWAYYYRTLIMIMHRLCTNDFFKNSTKNMDMEHQVNFFWLLWNSKQNKLGPGYLIVFYCLQLILPTSETNKFHWWVTLCCRLLLIIAYHSVAHKTYNIVVSVDNPGRMVITKGSGFTAVLKECSGSCVYHDGIVEYTYYTAKSQASANGSQTNLFVSQKTFQVDSGEETARASSGDRQKWQHLTS